MTATSSLLDQLREAPVVQRLHEQSFNRAIAYDDHQATVSDHHGVRAELLDELVEQLSNLPASELLKELRELGLLWSMVAQVVGVSDTAIRKWRRGEAIESTHHRRLARLVAFERLFAKYAAPGVSFAEWLDRSVVDGFSATPLQLLALKRDSSARHLQPLVDWMMSLPDAEPADRLLDRYLGAAWRNEAQEEQRFRIVTTASGDRVLVVDG